MTIEDIEKAAGEYSGSLLGFKDNVSVTDKHRAFIAGAEWRINTAWHEATEEPKHGEQILVLFKYGNLTSWFVSDDGLILGMPKFTPSKILEVNDITDWQQVRINAAIAAMQGLCGNSTLGDTKACHIAKWSVELSDSLIEELKKKE